MTMGLVNILTKVLIIIAVMALLIPTPVVNAQVVNFPDINLEAAIRDAIGKPTGGIYPIDLVGLTTLDASSRSISDLTGIEFCTSLTGLNLSDNQISDITPLSGLTSITYLELNENQISDITPLSGLTGLYTLWIDNNQVSDITPLANLTNLGQIQAQWNQISDITPLANLANLQYLSIGTNKIRDLSPLSSLTNLVMLAIGNQVSDLTPLSSLTNLTSLYLFMNEVTDISPIAGLTGLTTLQLTDNPLNAAAYDTYIPQFQSGGTVVDYSGPNTPVGSNVVVDPLADSMPGIIILTYDNVLTKGHTVFRGYDEPRPEWGPLLPGYTLMGDVFINIVTGAIYSDNVAVEVHYDESQVTNEDGLGVFIWDGLQWVNVTTSVDTTNDIIYAQTSIAGPGFFGEAPVEDLINFPDPNLEAAIRDAIGKPTGGIYPLDLVGLTTLDASSRSISDLTGIEHCTSLTGLELNENQISDITPLSGLTGLYTLWIDNNQVSDITPLANLTNLGQIQAQWNQISDITPLANLANLQYLSIGTNKIRDLSPLSSLTNLVMLAIGNQVSDLTPLSSLTNLTSLYLFMNEVTDISPIAGLTGLTTLQLTDNPLNAAAYDTYIPQFQSGGTVVDYSGPNTPVGSNVVVDPLADSMPGIIILTYDNVLTKGHTVFRGYDEPRPEWGPLLPGYTLMGDVFINIVTGAIYSDNVAVEVHYDESQVTNEDGLGVFIWDGLQWVNVTTSVDTTNDIIYAQTSIAGPGFFGEAPVEDLINPDQVSDLTVTDVSTNTVTLSWTAPGDDGNFGTASQYDIRMSTLPITEANWSSAIQLVPAPAPNAAGSSEAVQVVQLSPGITYYFAIKTADEVPNWSGLSNVASATTISTSASQVITATNTGIVTLYTSSGTIENLTAVPESSMPTEGKPNLQFPHGFFEFEITGLALGETVTVTLELPTNVPEGTQYWKYGPTPTDPTPHWYQITMGSDDGDNIITITLTDNGLGDDVLTGQDGIIVDQGGPGNPFPTPSGSGVPVFPSIYIGIAAAFGVAVLAFFVRKKLVSQA